MVEWQRKRRPEEVPAPVAIALSDFCRRAGSASPPDVVREALALLTSADDFRVRDLSEGEPEAQPLGPFAAVDLIFGTPAPLAAERQRTGYYDLVRQLALATNPPPAPSAPPVRATPRPPIPRPRVSAPPPPSAPPRRGKGKKQTAKERTLQERIAPTRRKDRPQATPPAPPPPAVVTWKKRELPLPKGRFSTVTAVKQRTSTLKEPRSKDFLEGLVAQSETRYAVLKALSAHYATKGRPVVLHEVEEALEHHGLLAPLSERERDGLIAQLGHTRGSLEKSAKNLGMTKPELLSLAKAVGAKKTVEEIRDRFVREALSPDHLTLRLDLAGKFKYLTDLGIARQFDTALTRDLKELFDAVPKADVFEVSRRTGFNAELLERAATRLGLIAPGPAERR